MNRFTRITLIVPALSLGLMLAACESFDPTSVFDAEIFNTKKKLPGERQAVFPEGTPGVQQGVPQELVKGYQPPEVAPPPPQAEAKPKPKPKPKVAAKPKEESTPTSVTVRPSQAQSQQSSQQQWPDPPPVQQQRSQSGGVAWPDPPPIR
jgi:outer membrane biosynthesis protein TonB